MKIEDIIEELNKRGVDFYQVKRRGRKSTTPE